MTKFTYKTKEALLAAAESANVTLPWSENIDVLRAEKRIGTSNVVMKNRLTVHPMEGFDSTPDGSPSELTMRRAKRFSEGGAGLIWLEATAVTEDGRTNTGQLWLNDNNVDEFAKMAETMHKLSDNTPLILQLTHSGRFSKPDNTPRPIITYHNPRMNEKFMIDPDYPVVTDEYLDALPEKFGHAAELAKRAGFDGVDVKCCHKYLFSELLSAYHREGRYGGTFENRTRLFVDSMKAAAVHCSDNFVLASRFGPYECLPYPWGFAADRDDYLKIDWDEPDKLYQKMYDCGVRLVDMTLGSPYINPHVNRPYDGGGYEPPEEPLTGVGRLINAAAHMKASLPGITLIGTGYSYLRQFAGNVAAGAVENTMVDATGFGRMAFAYPDFAHDLLETGTLDPHKICLTCSKCTSLMRAMSCTGCPIRDRDPYLTIYKNVFKND